MTRASMFGSSRAEFARRYSGERRTADIGMTLLVCGATESCEGRRRDLRDGQTEAGRDRPHDTTGCRKKAMQDAVGRVNRRAGLGGVRLEMDRPLGTAGVETGVGPRRGSGDEELQCREDEQASAGDRSTTIHRPLWYTMQR